MTCLSCVYVCESQGQSKRMTSSAGGQACFLVSSPGRLPWERLTCSPGALHCAEPEPPSTEGSAGPPPPPYLLYHFKKWWFLLKRSSQACLRGAMLAESAEDGHRGCHLVVSHALLQWCDMLCWRSRKLILPVDTHLFRLYSGAIKALLRCWGCLE